VLTRNDKAFVKDLENAKSSNKRTEWEQ